jgi:hypothetical protein
MLDEDVYALPKRRRARRLDLKSALGTALVSLMLAYLTAIAVVGIIAS